MTRLRQVALCDAAVKARPIFSAVHTFTAYRQGAPGVEARVVALAPNIADAEQASILHLQHKDTLLIHERHEGKRRGVLHAYRVRKGAAKYVRNPVSGMSERIEPLTLDKLFSIPVDNFEPTPAFDALRDNAAGIDATLLETR